MNELTTQVSQSIPFIGRILYAKSHDTFEESIALGLFDRLRGIQVIEVPELQLEVRLAGISRQTSTDIAVSGDRVLVMVGARSIKDKLAAELCNLLGAPDDLVDTVTRVLMEKDAEGIEDFLRVRRIGPLPEDVQLSLKDEAFKRSAGDECDGETEESQPPSSSGAKESGEVKAESSPTDIGKDTESTEANNHDMVDVLGGSRSALRKGSSNSTHDTHPNPADEGKIEPTGINGIGKSVPVSVERGSSDDSSIHGSGSEAAAPVPESITTYTDHSSQTGSRPKTSRTKRDRGRSQLKRTKAGRLMSYAASPGEAQNEGNADDLEKAAARNATGRAAVDYFLVTQSARWKSLTPMHHNNPGFDVKAVAHDGTEEFIEVKGQSAAWTEDGVSLTPEELMTAQRWGERYWLCVVEYAHDEKRRTLYLLKNPYGLTQQFRYDSGWKSAAISEAAAPLKPEAGLFIDIPGVGKGRIISVRRRGQFYGLHVLLDGGRQVNKTFNPATMKLSTE